MFFAPSSRIMVSANKPTPKPSTKLSVPHGPLATPASKLIQRAVFQRISSLSDLPFTCSVLAMWACDRRGAADQAPGYLADSSFSARHRDEIAGFFQRLLPFSC